MVPSGASIMECRYFSKVCTAASRGRESGHTGPFFEYLWGPLGANAGGRDAAISFFKRIRWHLDLQRRWDGSFAYDNLAIYVIFRVEDKYVKAVHSNHQDPVYTDSCVEFFFSPDDNSNEGYFNLEMNCGGTMLFHHQTEPRTNQVHIADEDIQQIEVASTLPPIVDPEIQEETIWSVEYRIPFSVLARYRDFPIPEKGTIWRANLYKCADATSHPHWLTWAFIDLPSPNFHQPDFFGYLDFQD